MKHTKLVCRIIIICLVLVITSIMLFIVFSRNIGDYYFSRKEYERSFSLYNLSYVVFGEHDTLVKIYYALELADGIDVEELTYYPKLIDDPKTDKNDTLVGLVFVSYLHDLYLIGEFDLFKTYYSQHINILEKNEKYILILSPIVDISDDPNAGAEMMKWGITTVDEIIGVYKTNNVKSFGYFLQSLLYERLGEHEKSVELLELSRSTPKNDEIQ